MLFELIITAHVIIEEKYKRYFWYRFTEWVSF